MRYLLLLAAISGCAFKSNHCQSFKVWPVYSRT